MGLYDGCFACLSDHSDLFHAGFDGQLAAMLPKPLSVDLIVGHDRGYHIPELFGMIHVGEMAELVNYHIIQYNRRRENQTVIKG